MLSDAAAGNQVRAGEIEQLCTWIITRDGNILNPRKVARLKSQLLISPRLCAGCL
ncbi:hypothetical protein ACRBEV_01850 [Methylobacterium phyllosphaerae]